MMAANNTLKIAIAEPSLIIRSGMAAVLKRIPGLNVFPVEIIGVEQLEAGVRIHKPEILIVNPAVFGCNDIINFKNRTGGYGIKCIALKCSVMDESLLKNYDESITLYDTPEQLKEKLERVLNVQKEEETEEQDVLSAREKEIIICVVKGMTNKEIADVLFLSAHTVITHRRNIARKLQIHSPAGLTIYAIVNKLVELQDIKASLPG